MNQSSTSEKCECSKLSDENVNKIYSHNVQIYLDIPTGDLDLRDLEQLALTRLHLFQLIENSSRNGYRTYSDEWAKNVIENLQQKYRHTFYRLCEQSAKRDNPTMEELEIRKTDYVSHYILRVCCSSSNKLRLWFIERELEWLYLRYQAQNMQSKQLFLELYKINYPTVDSKEKGKLLEHLCDDKKEDDIYYKIDFKKAIELIKNRKVYLKKGYAYVPFRHLIWCIMVHYRSYLNNVLLHNCRHIHLLDKNYISFIELIRHMINEEMKSVSYDTTDTNYSSENITISNVKRYTDYSSENITISDVKRYSKQNFPLCAKLMYDTLKEVHHLKYHSRLQLGTFLKAIGLSLEDSLKFWSREFTHKMTQTHFENHYLYNIKHMYGKVGQKKEYVPDTCSFLTSVDVGINEAHGCPFKTLDVFSVTNRLKQLRISQSVIDEIINEISHKQYQRACTKYFKAVHGVSQDIPINSPLEYFNKSRNILKQNKQQYEKDSNSSSSESE